MAIKKYSPSNNIMPSAVAETKELNGITITCDGNGTYTTSGTSTKTAEIFFELKEPITFPESYGHGGTGTLSAFNSIYKTGSNLFLRFYSNDTLIDSWNMNVENRTSSAYAALESQTITGISFRFSTGVGGNGTFSPMVTNDGQLPSEFVPHLIWNTIPYRKYETATDTLTSLPADVIADGQSASANIIGNMNQQGTPSPSSIIMPDECGDKTANLLPPPLQEQSGTLNGITYYVHADGSVDLSGIATANVDIDIVLSSEFTIPVAVSQGGSGTIAFNNSFTNGASIILYYNSTIIDSWGFTVVNRTGTSYSAMANKTINKYRINIVSGTDLSSSGKVGLAFSNNNTPVSPYEPYGHYKIPILSANTTTPVYLGQVESTRQIKKYEFTGQENWIASSRGYFYSDNAISDYDNTNRSYLQTTTIYSHYLARSNNINGDNLADKQACLFCAQTPGTLPYHEVYIKDNTYSTVTDFKAYLQQQYQAGTPVTIWYVLATPETAVVNEPIRKIGDYADTVSGITIPTITGKDTFDVQTTLKPSEVSLTYHGWHTGTVKEWDGSEWQ